MQYNYKTLKQLTFINKFKKDFRIIIISKFQNRDQNVTLEHYHPCCRLTGNAGFSYQYSAVLCENCTPMTSWVQFSCNTALYCTGGPTDLHNKQARIGYRELQSLCRQAWLPDNEFITEQYLAYFNHIVPNDKQRQAMYTVKSSLYKDIGKVVVTGCWHGGERLE